MNILNKKTCAALLFSSLALSASVFADSDGRICTEASFTNLYSEEKGKAFVYDLGVNYVHFFGNFELGLEASYDGLFSDLNVLSARASAASIRTSFKGFGAAGGIKFFGGNLPGSLEINVDDFTASQSNLHGFGILADASYEIGENMGLSAYGVWFTEKTGNGDLIVSMGTLSMPYFAGGGAEYTFPLEIYLGGGGGALGLDFNLNENKIGGGNSAYWYGYAGKRFFWDGNISHRLNTGAAYAGATAYGTATVLSDSFTFPFPINYARADGGFTAHFAGPYASYTLKKGSFSFDSDLAAFVNLDTDVRGYYKYAVRVNGEGDSDLVGDHFGMSDWLLWLSLRANYEWKMTEEKSVKLYAGRSLPIPIISSSHFSSSGTDSGSGSSSGGESGSGNEISWWRLALFAGLTVGISARF